MIVAIKVNPEVATNLVRCTGLKERLLDAGISVSKLQKISGLARNTITKVIEGQPVRSITADHLINCLPDLGILPEKTERSKIVHDFSGKVRTLKTPDGKDESSEFLIRQAVINIKNYKTIIEKIFDETEFDDKYLHASDLVLLDTSCKAADVYTNAVMKKYGLR